jgi:hypothetical protein
MGLSLDRKTKVRTAGGRELWLGPLAVGHVLGFRDWLRDQVGDPFARLDAPWFDKLPVDEQLRRVKAAEDTDEQLRKFSIICPLAQEWLATEAGAATFYQLLLQSHHPDATLDEALQVAAVLGKQADDERKAREAAAKAGAPEPEGNVTAPPAA